MDQQSEQQPKKTSRRDFLKEGAKAIAGFTALNIFGKVFNRESQAQSTHTSKKENEIIPIDMQEVSFEEFIKSTHDNESFTVNSRDVQIENKHHDAIYPTLTQDGSKIIYQIYDPLHESALILADFHNIKKKTVIPLHSVTNALVSSNLDGSKIIFSGRNDVFFLDTTEKKITPVQSHFRADVEKISLDGQKIAFAGCVNNSNKYMIYYGAPLDAQVIFEGDTGWGLTGVDLNVNGTLITFCYRGNIYMWSKTENKITPLTSYAFATDYGDRFPIDPVFFSTEVIGYDYVYKPDPRDDELYFKKPNIINIESPGQIMELHFPGFASVSVRQLRTSHATLENGFFLYYEREKNSKKVEGVLLADLYNRIFTTLSEGEEGLYMKGSMSMDGKRMLVPIGEDKIRLIELVETKDPNSRNKG